MTTNRKAVILIIDDDPIVQRFIGDVAKKALGYTAIGVSSIKEALQTVRDDMPSLIFFDRGLPDGTGRQLCEKLAKNPELKSVPKWVISGVKPVSWNSKEWSPFGVCGYIVKPVNIRLLVTTIRDTLKGNYASSI
jgi:DNA-binding NarL/FixJ family response regulator